MAAVSYFKFAKFWYFWYFVMWRSWNKNLRLFTKFHWNRLISGRDIAIKPFSKWRPAAILNFQNLLFWSRGLRLTVSLLQHTKFRVNRTINLVYIEPKDNFQYGGRPPYWICCDVIILHPGTLYYVPNIVLNFHLDWFIRTFWYT